ncbi:MAG: tyrosine-type recombinase/integrase [Pyrinomonadaceae bacterium]|jgi:site-specific recombinase XerD|nr:tyrosine-type recombinase/integrase [Pyrinomonadaceae bacterium]
MSDTSTSAEVLRTQSPSAQPPATPIQPPFDQKLAQPFIYKSVSAETRAAYHRAIREFFHFVGGVHPVLVTPAQVILYRDHLTVNKRRKANTVATKLAIVRSFFEYLKAAGIIPLNPASTKLVAPPELPTEPQGRALTPKEVRYLLSGPDRSKAEGARDYAIMLVMLRLSLRLAEASTLSTSSVRWSHGRWILRCKIKGGKEETWPLPKDVKAAFDDYLKLDAGRRRTLHSDGDEAYLFQPIVNYRTLKFDKPLSSRMIQKIVARWGEYGGIGKVTPHDLRRSVVTKLLNDGRSYRDVQMVTKHKDPKTLMRYDHARENLDSSPVNTLSWDE